MAGELWGISDLLKWWKNCFFWGFFWCMISEEDGGISRNLKWLQESTTGIVTFCTWDQTPLGVNKDSRYPLPAIPSPSRNRTSISTIRNFFHWNFLVKKILGIIQIFWILYISTLNLGTHRAGPSPRIGVQLAGTRLRSDPNNLAVLIPNYVNSQSNCLLDEEKFCEKTWKNPAEKGVVLVGKTWRRGPATFKDLLNFEIWKIKIRRKG